ncbi:MAG: peptidylprolyl isomerase [Deltaproteobacteria bacterium]|nr:MAG: peptidylprolyl isomerase [Deltaproteobacteria bacterium]
MVQKVKIWWLMPLLFLVLLILSCDKTKPPQGKELARVNDRVITLEEFNEEMEQLPPHLKPLMVSAEVRKEFLQNIIDRELLLQEARKKGVDKDKEILAKVERFKRGLIIESVLEELLKGKGEVSEEEARNYYRENKEKFLVGERVRVRHILVKTLPEAKEIKKRLNRGEDFIKLAKKYSISPSRERGGDLGYIERGKVGKEFERVAFSLKRRGEVSDIVKTNFGYHIIRLEDRKKPHQRTFSEVKEEIRSFLREKKMREVLTAHLKKLREGSKIVINEELLKAEEEGK